MNKLKIILTTILFYFTCNSFQAQTYNQTSVPNTVERVLYSKIMDYEYGVFVTLPRSYKENLEKKYPSLYILDGNQYFVYTHEPYGSLVWGNMVKEHITISVAYRPDKENFRGRDFRSNERAADFVKFFQNELIPFVEDNYRTAKKDRTLFGHSLGGHFTLYTMLNAPGTFENYISCAPPVSAEIMQFEEEFAAKHDDLPVKLFLASGENDHLTISVKRFSERFKSRNYPSLKISELYTINGNHGTIAPSAYIEGLRFVLDPVIELSPDKFQRLVGTYFEGESEYTIRYDGDNYLLLDDIHETYDNWIDAPLIEWRKIYPISETIFVSKGWPGKFEFGGDVSKQAETFKFYRRNSKNEIIAKRKN